MFQGTSHFFTDKILLSKKNLDDSYQNDENILKNCYLELKFNIKILLRK